MYPTNEQLSRSGLTKYYLNQAYKMKTSYKSHSFMFQPIKTIINVDGLDTKY